MQIAKSLAGFSGPKADDLRKAIGKKNREAMAKLKPRVLRGLPGLRHAPRTSSSGCGPTNEKSADYSFNKSHAACYALIAYRTAWLKANYPAEYMAALISSVMDTKDKVPFFVAQAEDDGDRDPAARRQRVRPRVHGRRGQHPLRARRREGRRLRRRGGDQARARGGGPFTSLWDFCERVDARTVNKKAIEALIKCGAFGSTGATRKGMLEVLEAAQGAGQKAQQDAQIGQGSIFDLGDARRRRGGGARAFAPVAPADPARGVRPARAAGDREGVDRPLHLRASAQARARGAAREGRLRAAPRSATARRRLGEGRRHDHRRRRRSARARARR